MAAQCAVNRLQCNGVQYVCSLKLTRLQICSNNRKPHAGGTFLQSFPALTWQVDELPAFFQAPIDEFEDASSWLHLAAAAGKVHLCRQLRRQGASKASKNKAGQTPSDVARLNGHQALATELHWQPHGLQMRGGTGDAIAKALDSEAHVVKVTWHICDLPGWRWVGAVHSMLQVQADAERFLIEGASPDDVETRIGLQRPEICDAAKKGIYVSKWDEKFDGAHNFLKLKDMLTLLVRDPKILVCDLVNHLISRDKYSAGWNNCHHTALAAYNFVAKVNGYPELRNIPINWWQSAVASMVEITGFFAAFVCRH